MNGSCISNWAVHPCSSGNDLPGVSKTEIDCCHQRHRQTRHLHTVGGCKQTPGSSHEASQQSRRPPLTAKGSRAVVIPRSGDDPFPFLLVSSQSCWEPNSSSIDSMTLTELSFFFFFNMGIKKKSETIFLMAVHADGGVLQTGSFYKCKPRRHLRSTKV